MTDWLSADVPADLALLAELWPDSVALDSVTLAHLLDVARSACAAYAPQTPADIPASWRQAQAMQARALSRAGVVGPGDQLGTEGITVTVYPLDWTVRQLLRPRRGCPVIA